MGERTLGRISTAVIDFSPPYMRRQVPPLNSEFASLLLWVVGLLERFPVSACWCGDCGCTTTPAWHLHERWGFELEVLGLCSRCSGHWSISPAQIYHRLYFVPMYFFFQKCKDSLELNIHSSGQMQSELGLSSRPDPLYSSVYSLTMRVAAKGF